MADDDTTIDNEIQRLQSAAAPAQPSAGPGNIFTGKRMIIGLFLVAGLFFAYVIWRRQQTQAANASGTAAAATDATQATGIASDQAALATLGQQITGGDQAITSQLAGIGTNANTAARDASGARTDASVILNTIKAHPPVPPGHPTSVTHIPPHAAPPVHAAPVHPLPEKYNHLAKMSTKQK